MSSLHHERLEWAKLNTRSSATLIAVKDDLRAKVRKATSTRTHDRTWCAFSQPLPGAPFFSCFLSSRQNARVKVLEAEVERCVNLTELPQVVEESESDCCVVESSHSFVA